MQNPAFFRRAGILFTHIAPLKMTTKGTSSGRITERQNQMGLYLDISTVPEILRSFRSIDGQLFRGYDFYETLYDTRIITTILDISMEIREIITGKRRGRVIMSGCGTSGRMAWLCARNFNRLLKINIFDYTIAGGDKALIMSQEGPEDFPKLGRSDLEKVINQNDEEETIIYIGITCGLSALYVGGQLEYFYDLEMSPSKKNKKKVKAVLMGFNPKELARNTPVLNWKMGTFKKLMDKILDLDSENFFLLNPVYGPEGIQGSTRMKGGSITKILLDVIFVLAQRNDVDFSAKKKSSEMAVNLIREFETTYQYTYEQIEKISSLCERCGASFNSGGRVFYVGTDTTGIIGLIDASECLPTFGSDFEDIRGFVHHGWREMDNKIKPEEMSGNGIYYQIAIDDFLSNYAQKVTEKDTVIFLSLGSDDARPDALTETYMKIKEKKCKFYSIQIMNKRENETKEKTTNFVPEKENLRFEIPKIHLVPGLQSHGDFSMKLILNAVSTSAHILRGMVFSNIMINVRLANTKLVTRAINIVSNILSIPEKQARESVLRAIWEDEDYSQKNVNDHVDKGFQKSSVVPVAMLLALRKCKNVKEAREKLKTQPILRNLVQELVK